MRPRTTSGAADATGTASNPHTSANVMSERRNTVLGSHCVPSEGCGNLPSRVSGGDFTRVHEVRDHAMKFSNPGRACGIMTHDAGRPGRLRSAIMAVAVSAGCLQRMPPPGPGAPPEFERALMLNGTSSRCI
jgi:hypothetical protein